MISSRETSRRSKQRLEALSRRAYTAVAGHLEVEPEPSGEEPVRRRWSVTPRPAVAAVGAIVLVAGLVAVRAFAGADPSPPEPVPLAAGWASAEDALGTPAPGSARAEAPGTAAEAPGEEGAPGGTGAAGHDAAAGAPRGPVGGSAAPGLVVHVAGHVADPGVRELPAGSRVHEALVAAGGATETADLTALNLARPLVDGEQVYVPAPGEAPRAAAGPSGAGPAAPTPLVNLNTATAEEFDALPGIGPVLAGRIVDWRTEHGRFTAIEELGEVSGIGPAVLGRLRDLVTL